MGILEERLIKISHKILAKSCFVHLYLVFAFHTKYIRNISHRKGKKIKVKICEVCFLITYLNAEILLSMIICFLADSVVPKQAMYVYDNVKGRLLVQLAGSSVLVAS